MAIAARFPPRGDHAGPPQRAPAAHRRAEAKQHLRVVLVSALFAVVAGLLAIEALVVVAICPRVVDLAHAGAVHARAVGMTARLRERLSALRRDVLVASAGLPPMSGTARASDEFRALEDETSQLARGAETAFEKEGVAKLRAALEECADEAASIEGAVERDPGRVRARIASSTASIRRAARPTSSSGSTRGRCNRRCARSAPHCFGRRSAHR